MRSFKTDGWLKLRVVICLSVFVLISNLLSAQTRSFEFLNLPGNATLSALGGVNVSSANQNVNFFQSNPALAGDTTNGWSSASYLFYFANIIDKQMQDIVILYKITVIH